MNKSINRLIVFLLVASFATFAGCKKEDAITIPPEQVHFLGETAGSYTIVVPNSSFKVKVGVTTVSNVDRTFTISVSSPTGAASPAQYTLSKTSITIPAGKAIDSIEVKGNFAAYQSGRKDTLVFNITQAGKEAGFNSTYKLALRGPCFEGDVDLNLLKGDYAKSNEDFGGAPYGPYTTSITAVSNTSPTTGTITVANIFDAGWGPIKFNLDWTNPNNRTVTLIQQSGIANAGTLSPTYAGRDVSVRAFAGAAGVGTFSICNQTLVLKMQLGVTGVGFFTDLYMVDMKR